MISHFISEEEGQTLVEYGLLISLIALAVIAAVGLFGRTLQQSWNSSNTKLGNAFTPPS
jgi:pilus assembly protein Flp/PilA